jgi:hypothetical protein
LKTKRAIPLVLSFAFCILSSGPAHADDNGFLPRSHEVFKPLLADPRELQYAVRLVAPVGHKLFGEAAMGDYLGLYRWTQPDSNRAMQVSVGGGVFGRFDLAGTSNDMQSADFYANLPFDIRRGAWSGRFMLYHTSAHLGDDYLKTHGITTNKHAWDNLRLLVSNDLNPFLRGYAGYTYAFRTLPQHTGRSALQTGFECTSAWWANGHSQIYWANDFQSWERIAWNPAFNSQVGVRLAQDRQSGRALSLFLEFMTGAQPQGQFYLQKETHWNLGLKFDLG